MEMPKDTERNFDRLYREIDLRLLDNDAGKMIPSAWIDRFRRTCEAQAFTNVKGMMYGEFRSAFIRHYRKDFEWVSGRVTQILGENPTGKLDMKLLEKLSAL